MSQSLLVFFFTLQLQFYGFLMLYEMFEMRRNYILLIYLTNKKDQVNRKRKYLLSRKLGRKKRLTWVPFEERTEDWWNKMLFDDFSEKFLKLQNEQRSLSRAGYNVRSIYWSQNYSKLSETLYSEKVGNGFILLERYAIIMDDCKCFRGTSVYGF